MSGFATTKEACDDAQVPQVWRDTCAHLLIPLNECRKKEHYLPWKCEHERHVYELCQYKDYKKRVKEAEASRQ
ncbi:NADH:ubiquinone oxidoreductase [Chloropicon primus]|uniref:NADH dehydrogenase [ubiquinone] 1 beta subcomplex subunit 7 n=1 Tax=Chloropicon primus TaxID=1764295 RepID=A0A5B8MZM8_9CHLO|nr:NADH:ubiquinone oxidoreductase [Chloropicon primus]UPR05234.1 NADH:ubiquinone oxidoreductase [Chloropicon primus]|eukprot:QDZ26033.1 NADH:ubiquinone oxidoreductase [Chloropicon primus]